MIDPAVWRAPPDPLRFASGDIHVWIADLDAPDHRNALLWDVLDAPEQARVRRFRQEHDAQRYLVAHGLLRALLGLYLGVEPRTVGFVAGAFGKPALDTRRHPRALHFNISHSDRLALFAFGRDDAIGVDIEREHAFAGLDAVASRFFSPREVSALLALAPDQRLKAFFRCWSRKEAYIKATGRGLSQPLAGFDVSLQPEEPARLLCVAGAPAEVGRWRLHDLSMPDYAAALATACAGCRVFRWHLAAASMLERLDIDDAP